LDIYIYIYIYIGILLGAHYILHISRIRVNLRVIYSKSCLSSFSIIFANLYELYVRILWGYLKGEIY